MIFLQMKPLNRLMGFLRIYSLHNTKIKYQTASADQPAAREFPLKLTKIIESLTPHQVWNSNEMGLLEK